MYKFYIVYVNVSGTILQYHYAYLKSCSNVVTESIIDDFYYQLGNYMNVILSWQYVGIWEDTNGQDHSVGEARSKSVAGHLPDL